MSDKNPANQDPISGAPGAHPVGTGVGAAGGAMAGPVGTVVGGAIGAVAGAMAGKGAAEAVNPTAEDSYWRDNYTKASGYKKDYTYDDYAPAYRLGYNGWSRYGGAFDQSEGRLSSEWESIKGQSRLSWTEARQATRAAWDRVERAIPGDFDKDGR